MPGRQDARIPADRAFATKPELARQMLARVLEACVPFAWFTADEAYGQNPGLRKWLETEKVAYALVATADPRRHLMIRRSLHPGETGTTEIACYLCWAPRTVILAEFARVAGARWGVEDCFAEAKNETGLGTILTPDGPLIALTAAEIRRLWNQPPDPGSPARHWSTWRRQHQARAKISHYRRRSEDHTCRLCY